MRPGNPFPLPSEAVTTCESSTDKAYSTRLIRSSWGEWMPQRAVPTGDAKKTWSSLWAIEKSKRRPGRGSDAHGLGSRRRTGDTKKKTTIRMALEGFAISARGLASEGVYKSTSVTSPRRTTRMIRHSKEVPLARHCFRILVTHTRGIREAGPRRIDQQSAVGEATRAQDDSGVVESSIVSRSWCI